MGMEIKMIKLKKMAAVVFSFILLISLSACMETSDVKSVVVPEDAVENKISGKYKNSSDENIWQFNENGTLLIGKSQEESGEYNVKYKDSSMYLTNTDGATIEFYYLEKEDGSIEVTINGKNADTSTLIPVD